MTCQTCNGTGRIDRGGFTEDCLVCIIEGYCPRCDRDNISVVYTEGEFAWPWDGTTPCPGCGWSLDQDGQQ